MLDTHTLMDILRERLGNSRNLDDKTLRNAVINASNDLISEYKQNVLLVNYQASDANKVIRIPNIAFIYQARFDGRDIPIIRITHLNSDDSRVKLIVLDTQSVRLEPLTNGSLEILGSFYVSKDANEIPLSPLFQRAILQGAILDLYIILDKPAEHIQAARVILTEIKDELRSQINRAQEKQVIFTKGVRI